MRTQRALPDLSVAAGLVAATLLGLPLSGMASDAGSAPPRLLVLIVVDQLRADLPFRYRDHFTENGGLRRFIDDGIYYRQSFYNYTATSTAPGHATISTGTVPASHGIVGNAWYDRASGTLMAAVTDASETLTGVARKAVGASPRRLRASTFADSLIEATGGRARVYGVSAKDRGAIFTAGRGGKAFWYSPANGNFVSSSYYYPDKLPAWARARNAKGLGNYPNIWTLARRPAQYRLAGQDDRASERPVGGMGRVFPHPLGEYGSPPFFDLFKRSPLIDEWTVDFALALLENEKLGSDEVTDFLSVSLSATDYVGHYFGPESLEAEDNLIRLDAVLGRFLDAVEKRVGAENLVFALTADHGVGASPEYLLAHGLPGQRINVNELEAGLNAELRRSLAIDVDLVQSIFGNGVFLDRQAAARAGAEMLRVTDAAIGWLRAHPGIAVAVTPENVDRVPGEIGRLLRNNYDAERAGDVLIVQAGATFYGTAAEAATHGSPYGHDRHVPIAFLMPARKGRMIWRPVAQTSLAPTLAQLAGVPPPSHAFSAVLRESLE